MARTARMLPSLAAAVVLVAVGIGIGTWGTRAVLPRDDAGDAVTAEASAGSATITADAAGAAGTTLEAPRGDGWLAWGARPDGSPLRWNPCSPIDWVVRPDDPPWLPDVAGRALDEVGAAAGVQFRHLGTMDVGVGSELATTDGGRWQPVLVTFTSPDETNWLTTDDRAVAVPVQVGGVFVTGQVLLDGSADLAGDFSSRDGSWGATLLHEAGHLVGLDHVDDPTQLLHAYPRPGPATLADGDLRGLAALRADGRCLPGAEPRDIAVPTPTRRGP